MWDFFKEVFITIKELVMWGFRYKRKKSLKEDLESSEKINRILSQIMNEHYADRCLVFQFHNGEYFYTGHSIDKMSNTHEVVSKGVSREQLYSANIYTSPFRQMMRQLLSNDVVVYSDIANLEDYNTKVFFSERGAKSVIMTLLRDKAERPVGLLCMEYVKGYEPGVLSDDKSIVQAGHSIHDLLVYGRIKK